MTLDSLKQRLNLLIGRARNDYWPRLRQDLVTRAPRSLFFRALLLGLLLSVPWQCTRIVYSAIFAGDESKTVERTHGLNAPSTISSVTGMPNPKARRPATQGITPAAPEAESDMTQTLGHAIQQAPTSLSNQEARIIERKALDYPIASLRNGEAGSVIIRVRIDATGNPIETKIEQSSGFRNLDRAARQAVMRWIYAPKIVNGTPVVTEILVPVDFKIGN